MSKTHYRLQNNIHAMFEELSSRRYFPLKKKRTKIERKKKDGERRKTKKKRGRGEGGRTLQVVTRVQVICGLYSLSTRKASSFHSFFSDSLEFGNY